MDERIEAIFLEEAQRRLAEVERVLEGPFPERDSRGLETLQRHAHSLKGVAGTLGHDKVAVLAAEIWSELDEERRGRAPPDAIEEDVRRQFQEIADEVRHIADAQK